MWRKKRGGETQYDALKNLDKFLKFIVSLKLLDTHNIFFSGEPCFQGRPILYFTDPYAFTLPLQGYVPRPFISISISPHLGGIRSRSSQQSVLEARTLPLSYRGRAILIMYWLGRKKISEVTNCTTTWIS